MQAAECGKFSPARVDAMIELADCVTITILVEVEKGYSMVVLMQEN